MTGNPVELFRKFFDTVRAILWLWGSFWLLTLDPLIAREEELSNPPDAVVAYRQMRPERGQMPC